jgi:hypothetical protein
MKILSTQEANEKCEFMYIECNCGFHIGLDATYLDQVGDIILNCPACINVIYTKDLYDKNGLEKDN